MSRTKGAKDLKPRKKRPEKTVLKIAMNRQEHILAGCDRIIEAAIKKGLIVDLWIMLDAFRRLRNL